MDIDTTNEENKDWLLVIIFWKIMCCVKALRKRNEARPAHSHLLTKPWNKISYILKETYPNNWFAKISQMNNTHKKKKITLRNNKGARVCFHRNHLQVKSLLNKPDLASSTRRMVTAWAQWIPKAATRWESYPVWSSTILSLLCAAKNKCIAFRTHMENVTTRPYFPTLKIILADFIMILRSHLVCNNNRDSWKFSKWPRFNKQVNELYHKQKDAFTTNKVPLVYDSHLIKEICQPNKCCLVAPCKFSLEKIWTFSTNHKPTGLCIKYDHSVGKMPLKCK